MAKSKTRSETESKHFSKTILDAIGIKAIDGSKDKFAGSVSGDIEVNLYIPDAELFSVMRKVRRGDWLSEHKERGQTFNQYITGMRNVPGCRHNTIYLWPLTFKEEPIPQTLLTPLQEFAQIFFGIPVKVKKVKSLQGRVPSRINDNSHTYQVDAAAVLTEIKNDIPSGAFCVAGITMCDLYPRKEWNFVFGLANLSGMCGVYSLARYLSNFGSEQNTEIDIEIDSLETLIRRSCKTMCHEIGHMFGLKHCIHFDCVMNGSNHLDESDRRPLFLCPVCLRKLQSSCKFDVTHRYQQMLEFTKEHKLSNESDWLELRLQKLSSGA